LQQYNPQKLMAVEAISLQIHNFTRCRSF